MFNRREVLIGSAAAFAFGYANEAHAIPKGTFSDHTSVKLLSPPKGIILEPLSYRDPTGRYWRVPKDWEVDGASIPRFLWTAAGSPWGGPYADASVIHDYYCDTMERSWEETHLVFYYGMISRGVSKAEATSKYWAVYNFGPRWDKDYRWTSFLGLYRAPYRPVLPRSNRAKNAEGSGPYIVFFDWDREDKQEFGEEAERQYRLAAARIASEGLGPEDVPSLKL